MKKFMKFISSRIISRRLLKRNKEFEKKEIRLLEEFRVAKTLYYYYYLNDEYNCLHKGHMQRNFRKRNFRN